MLEVGQLMGQGADCCKIRQRMAWVRRWTLPWACRSLGRGSGFLHFGYGVEEGPRVDSEIRTKWKFKFGWSG